MCGFVLGCTGPRLVDEPESMLPDKQKPFNIIFMIGDGMGLSQLSTAYYYGNKEPNFSRFLNIGMINTSSASHKITDSAAGATAFACGVKTYNGAIGVDKAGKAAPTILEQLAAKGYSTGLISTSAITHATPASFYAHVAQRSMQEDIASQMIHSPVDFFAGGGTTFFARRSDGLNYLDSLTLNGFVVDTTDIASPITKFNKKPAYLMAAEGLIGKHEGRGEFLSMATHRAVEYLSGKDAPFFLMVESSQIDWGGHANNADYIIQETLEFDEVIGQVLDFAKRDGNTLVVVTADHETGGFTLASGTVTDSVGNQSSDYDQIAPVFSTGGHSTTLIPVFAWGRGSKNFRGIYQNTNIYFLFKELAGL